MNPCATVNINKMGTRAWISGDVRTSLHGICYFEVQKQHDWIPAVESIAGKGYFCPCHAYKLPKIHLVGHYGKRDTKFGRIQQLCFHVIFGDAMFMSWRRKYLMKQSIKPSFLQRSISLENYKKIMGDNAMTTHHMVLKEPYWILTKRSI